MNEKKRINIQDAINSANQKKIVLEKELSKIAEKEKALAAHRSAVNAKIAKLEGFISSQNALLQD